MYIDFEDLRPETPHLERALSVREGVLISIIVHLLLFIAILVAPDWLPESLRSTPAATEVAMQSPGQDPRFVFVQPKLDISKPQPKPNVDRSDQDRVKSTIEKPPDPKNAMPFARGNSRELEEADLAPPNRGNAPETSVAQGTPEANAEGQMAANDPSRSMKLPDTPNSKSALNLGNSPGGRGVLGNALKNLQRYVQEHSFDNIQGSGDAEGLIQFDSKGVDFGPWLRRFVAQVKRNWFVPQAAMIMKGHVVITFNIHRNGAITDIEVKQPSSIEAFNHAAVNALLGSNPTQPLPPEYPSDSAFFTVTFLYNEDPADFR